jgi:hypothetical protein
VVLTSELRADLVHALGTSALFKGRDETQRSELAGLMFERHLVAGASLITEGEPGDRLYYTVQGEFDVYKILNGTNCKVRLLWASCWPFLTSFLLS